MRQRQANHSYEIAPAAAPQATLTSRASSTTPTTKVVSVMVMEVAIETSATSVDTSSFAQTAIESIRMMFEAISPRRWCHLWKESFMMEHLEHPIYASLLF